MLVIAFAGLGEVGGREIWGANYFRKCGFSFVSFVPQQAHWYPDAALAISHEIDDFIADFDHRVTYGYSMGGHAALKTAKLFEARRVVAMCPQYSIDPSVIKDERYNAFWTAECGTHLRALEPSGARRLVFSDRDCGLDQRHLDKFRQVEIVEQLNCTGAGHEIWNALDSRGMIGVDGPITYALRGEITPKSFAKHYEATTR